MKIKEKATKPKISFLPSKLKKTKTDLKYSLNKQVSGLIKKLTNGTSKAIEIDSDKEEKTDKKKYK